MEGENTVLERRTPSRPHGHQAFIPCIPFIAFQKMRPSASTKLKAEPPVQTRRNAL